MNAARPAATKGDLRSVHLGGLAAVRRPLRCRDEPCEEFGTRDLHRTLWTRGGLPRVVDDDYAVMVLRGKTSADSLEAALLAALHKMRSLGGLDLVTLHTQLIDSEPRVDAIETVVRAARDAGDVWIAGTAELADWWMRRSQLEVQVRERSDLSAVVSVRNAGLISISSAWVHVLTGRCGDVRGAGDRR